EIDPNEKDDRRTVRTIVGTGRQGFAPNGTKAAEADLNQPGGVAIDPRNNDILFTEHNHVVRRVHEGKIQTVAGNGTPGFSGDGGDATKAQLHEPVGLAIGDEGEIYVADALNDRIRMINKGKISTVVGTGEAGFNFHSGKADEINLNLPWGLKYIPG